MKQTRARIPDTELAYYENTIASALSIIRLTKGALYWTDDPDQIRILSLVIAEAQELRKTTIDRMHQQKQGATHVPEHKDRERVSRDNSRSRRKR